MATRELCNELRNDILLPTDPRVAGEQKVYDDIASGILRGIAFAGCKAGEWHVSKAIKHESSLWNHLWLSSGHQKQLRTLMRRYALTDGTQEEEEVAFTLYNAAIAERERLSVPQLGLCTDRKCLRHIGETFFEGNMQELMCFICGGKHIR